MLSLSKHTIRARFSIWFWSFSLSCGWVAEWFKAAVLKTAVGSCLPWVRISPHPPSAFAYATARLAPQETDKTVALAQADDRAVAKRKRASPTISKPTQLSDHPQKMHYTYILQSQQNPDRFYIGSTSDLKRRLLEHNSSKSIHTNKFLPWKIKNYFAFEDQEKAEKFEKFLKSGNGRIFAKKHF